ncbi:MAG: hypothetical protein CMJ50_09700, partial [Planctomycetaceae bacterium]|nr:hypothetical protein [Planctomycetaceae bacterium]
QVIHILTCAAGRDFFTFAVHRGQFQRFQMMLQYGIADCLEIVGDDIAQTVRWKESPDVGTLSGKPVRLRFVMAQCDLYSFRFK